MDEEEDEQVVGGIFTRKPVNERLRECDPELIRLDIAASEFVDWSDWQKRDFLNALPHNKTIRTVHLSGHGLDKIFDGAFIEELVPAIGTLKRLEDLCVFKGDSKILDEVLLSKLLKNTDRVEVLMLWDFDARGDNQALVSAMRNHPSIERLTFILPNRLSWGCLDLYAMGFASMPKLRVLQIRCQGGRQKDAIVSPEAIPILLSSAAIRSLYLENLGLLDDHIDAIKPELEQNKILSHLDLKDNLFTEDTLYTMARTLPNNQTLKSLDLSGVIITDEAGQALANALEENTTLLSLEIEGDAERYADEFNIPKGHTETDWWEKIYYHIRMNRANANGSVKESRIMFVDALSSVSDQLGCLYYFIRHNPGYCDRLSPMAMVS